MFYKSIHYLRAIAALAVVIHHATPGGVPALGAGVDVFFVISGFVIFHTAQRTPRRLDFLAARIRRIYPLWIAASLLALFISWAGIAAFPHARPYDPALFLQSLALVTAVGHEYPRVFHGVGWSLAYEMMFYLVFAAFMDWRAVSVAVASMIAVGLFLNPIWQTAPVMLEFVAGMALASYCRDRRPPFWLLPVGVLALVIFLTLPVPTRPLQLGFPALMIVAGAIGFEDRLPKSRVATMLGDASYAIYLFHFPAYWLIGPLWWPLLALCGVGAGVAAHLGIERTLTRLMKDGRQAAAPVVT
ncbi:acyltransferase family protein [Halovulum sp. GXIMD14794]